MKLNIGCGRDYRPGWINIDLSQEVKTDMTADVRFGLPDVKSDSVDEIYISGVLEQIGPNEQFLMAMNECNRVLKRGGLMTVIVPNARHAIAHRDPMDVRKFTRETFAYFDGSTQEYRDYGSVYGFLPWQVESIGENQRHIFTAKFIR